MDVSNVVHLRVHTIMGKHTLLLLCLLWSLTETAWTQDRPSYASASTASPPAQSVPFKDRLFFGGNLGLNFGSLTYINVSPLVGVRLTDKMGVGVGPTYTYFSDRRTTYKYDSESYGGRLFAQYRIVESVLLYSEYELLNTEVPNLLYTALERRNISSLFVGGGYIQQIGRNSGISITLLYNVLEGDYPIYENPLIRTGFLMGF